MLKPQQKPSPCLNSSPWRERQSLVLVMEMRNECSYITALTQIRNIFPTSHSPLGCLFSYVGAREENGQPDRGQQDRGSGAHLPGSGTEDKEAAHRTGSSMALGLRGFTRTEVNGQFQSLPCEKLRHTKVLLSLAWGTGQRQA